MESAKDQVLISFRGKDQRYGFLTHLKAKLKVKLNVFTDEDGIGKPLAHLLEEIRKSRIVIVLFTENFAESYWCLDELVVIAECIETKQLEAVIPIFYKVAASTVQELSGEFGKKYLALQNSLLAKAGDDEEKKKNVDSRIQGWKHALKVVSEMIGLSYVEKSSEDEFAAKIAEKVTKLLGQIAAKEGCSITPEPDKAQASNTTVINLNVNQLNINNHFHNSTTLDALFLAGRIFEGYNRSQNLKPQSPNFTPYVEKPPGYKILEPNAPQEGPHPAYRRTLSYPDDIDHFYPLHLETVLVPKEDNGKRSNVNIDPRNHKNGSASCVSFLSYYFKLCFCLASGAENELEDSRNETSFASNN